ncbi:TMV resistance protein N-like [Vigna unguiculata]|uniref:TMV resistance protein N-like n=1 Tax=Vigna unguiculata TaxID=3917 RepID=UPI0010164B1E|nr:TMV resistance protein N-like [Vigna unguiculata]
MSYTSSSSKSKPQWVYDVFISFRGEDTRKNFVSHLYSALTNAGVNTFLDDKKLAKGQQLKPELLHSIEGSQISIVVFSENYIFSKWCLDELVKIMECHAFRGQVVLPVFYDVFPSFLRNLNDVSFEEDSDLNRVKQWKKALSEAAGFVGWDVSNYRNENFVVKEMVTAVLERLDRTYMSITDFPVGLEYRVEHCIGFLRKQTKGAYILGIWGMGGIGKTTIAKAIYNEIRYEFKHKSFLANIREVWQRDFGRIDLQERLLSDILKTEKVKVYSIDWGKAMIKETLCTKRVLVVLDDVNTFEQLNALSANSNGIAQGSVIIITTRDVRLLNMLDVEHVYEVEEMNEIESLELFSWHAFKEANPPEGFLELSKQVVTYCGALPLALEILGSYLYKRRVKEWQSVLSKLKEIPNDKIQEKLKISYDGLTDHTEKDIFLDVCCFFIGKDRGYVTEILNGCGLHAEIGITVLVERSLIKIEKNNKLGIHDLLRDMGREIVRGSSPLEPQKRSRLWVHDDVLDILTEHTGTGVIEGLALKMQRTSGVCFGTETFEKMKRLRLLQLDHVQLAGDYGRLPKQLRWVHWKAFSLTHMPENFYQENIVAIDLKYSYLKLVWKVPPFLERLKFLNLSHSRYLSKTPDFSKLPNLEKLILKDCPSLYEVHHSIGDLNNLLLLNLKDCTCLGNLPMVIYKLKSLQTLILSGCSNIDKLEEAIGKMESLTTLIADNTSIKQVPFAIVRSKKIGYISLCGYEGLTRNVFPSLIWSWMSHTRGALSCIQPFGITPTSIVALDIQDTNLVNLLSKLSEFSKLRSISVQCDSDFQLTQELRSILHELCNVNSSELENAYLSPISENSMVSCLIGMGSYQQVFDMLSNSISEVLRTNSSNDFVLPGDNYPYWLAYTGEGHSVPFQVPEDGDCRMNGMLLCIVYSSTPENMATQALTNVFIFNYTKCTIEIFKHATTMLFSDEDWQGVISSLGPGDNVEIFVGVGDGITAKKTAVYLIYGQSITMRLESLGLNAQESPELSVILSPKMSAQPTTDVEMEAKKPKKNTFAKIRKKVRVCSCLK